VDTLTNTRLTRALPWAAAPAQAPAPLSRLLRREGLTAGSVRPITTRPGRGSPRQAFRILLSDGRLLKGRVVHRAEIIERMRRWLPLLPAGRFSELLAADETASLETWCRGPAATAADRATIETAGGMLGALHRLLPRQVVDEQDDRWLAWWRRLDPWIDELAAAGRLTDAERVRARVAATRPTRATWGLTHRDFCLENLVVGDGGLCCIDNTTVAPGFLEADLARTFYRWPLAASEREVFLQHYRHHAEPAGYQEHLTFWHLTVALQSAAWHCREECDGIEVPLAELARHVV
jgi:hypothetical protein